MVLLQILHLQLQFLQFILLHMNQLREPCFLFFLRYHPDLLLCKSLYYLVFVLSGTGFVHMLLHPLFLFYFVYLFVCNSNSHVEAWWGGRKQVTNFLEPIVKPPKLFLSLTLFFCAGVLLFCPLRGRRLCKHCYFLYFYS